MAWKFKVCLVRRICMLTIFWECTFNTWQLLYLSCLTLLFLIFLPCAERAALDRQVMCLFLIQLHGSTYMTCMILSFIPTIGPRHSSTHRLISGTSGAHPKWSPDLRWPMKVRATIPSWQLQGSFKSQITEGATSRWCKTTVPKGMFVFQYELFSNVSSPMNL